MIPAVRQKQLPGTTGTQVDFGLEEVTYPATIPTQQTLEARTYVRKMLRPSILGSEKPSWNSCTIDRDCKFPDPNLKRVNSKGFSIRPEIDFRAEVLPKRDCVAASDAGKFRFQTTTDEKERKKMERSFSSSPLRTTRYRAVIHPDLEDAKEWNASTCLDKSQAKKLGETLLTSALTNSKRTARKMDIGNTTMSLVEREKEYMGTIREKKRMENGSKQFSVPDVTTMTVDFDVLAREAQKQQMDMGDVVFSQAWKKKEFEHIGCWKFSDIEGREAWSCCMNTRYDSAGCCVRKPRVTKGWNLTSF